MFYDTFDTPINTPHDDHVLPPISCDTPVIEPEHCCMAVGKALGEVRLTPIAPNVWSLFTMHGPGNSRFAPKIPNRLLVFRLRDTAGRALLVLLNAVHPDEKNDEPFTALRKLSQTLGAPIRFILNPGPEHHLSLSAYAHAFPDARVCVAAGRIERENPELCALDNVETMAVGDALPELSRMGFHIHVWGGFMEGTFINRSQFRFGAPRGTAEPTVFWHEQSGCFINGGHGWYNWAVGDKALAFPFRQLIKPREGHIVWSPIHYAVHDVSRAIDGAERILDWRFRHILELHTGLDKHVRDHGHGVAEQLLRPLIEQDWEALPFGCDTLQIPEGFITGGRWKSYRKALRGAGK